MITFICSTMMSPLRFAILVIFGVVTSQNHDVNSKIPHGGRPTQSSVESTTLLPPDPTVENEGMRLLLTRLETLCVEKLENLITDTNNRFQSLENQSSEVHSTVNNIRDELDRIDYPLTRLENLLIEKLDSLTTEVGRISQCCAVPATPIIHNNKTLEANVKNLRLSEDLSSNTTLDRKHPRNCREVGEFEKTASGNYMIQPEHASKPFEAVCELETRGGGWTVIQRRLDGSQDFYLGWEDYKKGFGNLGGEFWLGLENIHLLTGYEENELLIELGDFESQNSSAFYSRFNVGSEMEGYSLKVLGTYEGNAGDSLTYHAGCKFTTKDNDQDMTATLQCAHHHGGAWWYLHCACANLNVKYFDRGQKPTYSEREHTIHWDTLRDVGALKRTRMLVRPKV